MKKSKKMQDTFEIKNEKGERTCDPSTRFAAHPSGDVWSGIMEPIHNMLSYGKNTGTITIKDRGDGLFDYTFFNEGDKRNIPTYDELERIARTAGSSISSRKGVSVCGMGIEVMALSARKSPNSCVTVKIEVTRDRRRYGVNLIYNGEERKVKFEKTSEQPIDTKTNSFEITFSNCAWLTKRRTSDDINRLVTAIADTMSPNGKMREIVLNHDNKSYTIKPFDFLYREKLEGSENFKSIVLYDSKDKSTRNKVAEVEIADVRNVIQGKEGKEEYEYHKGGTKLDPYLSGAALKHNGISTICRGLEGWKFIGKKKIHPTEHNIRVNIEIFDNALFTQIHEESQVKTKATKQLTDLKGGNNQELKLYDENGKAWKVGEIKKNFIDDFINSHKSGDSKKAKTTAKETADKIMEKVSLGTVSMDEIRSTVNVLGVATGFTARMGISTLKNELETILNNENCSHMRDAI